MASLHCIATIVVEMFNLCGCRCGWKCLLTEDISPPPSLQQAPECPLQRCWGPGIAAPGATLLSNPQPEDEAGQGRVHVSALLPLLLRPSCMAPSQSYMPSPGNSRQTLLYTGSGMTNIALFSLSVSLNARRIFCESVVVSPEEFGRSAGGNVPIFLKCLSPLNYYSNQELPMWLMTEVRNNWGLATGSPRYKKGSWSGLPWWRSRGGGRFSGRWRMNVC